MISTKRGFTTQRDSAGAWAAEVSISNISPKGISQPKGGNQPTGISQPKGDNQRNQPMEGISQPKGDNQPTDISQPKGDNQPMWPASVSLRATISP